MQGSESSSSEIYSISTDHPQYNDVIFSPRYTTSHPGTILFNRLVHQTINNFIAADTSSRLDFVAYLISLVQSQSPSGRFLEFDESTRKFQVIDTTNAFEKIYIMLIGLTKTTIREKLNNMASRVETDAHRLYRFHQSYLDELRDYYIDALLRSNNGHRESTPNLPLSPVGMPYEARKRTVDHSEAPVHPTVSLASSHLRNNHSMEQETNFFSEKDCSGEARSSGNSLEFISDPSKLSSQLSGYDALMSHEPSRDALLSRRHPLHISMVPNVKRLADSSLESNQIKFARSIIPSDQITTLPYKHISSDATKQLTDLALEQLNEGSSINAHHQQRSNSSKRSLAVNELGTTAPLQPSRFKSAYNFFFMYEREVILQSITGKMVDDSDGNYDGMNMDGTNLEIGNSEDKTVAPEHEANIPSRYRLVHKKLLQYSAQGGRSTRRKHRKSHGAIGFQALSQMVSSSWRQTDQATKDFFNQLASQDLDRYQKERRVFEMARRGNNESNTD